MIFHSNNHPTHIVTTYTYIVKGLYIVTILSLLRESIYTKLLYASRVLGISKGIHYHNFLCLGSSLVIRLSESVLRQIHKSSKSEFIPEFISQVIEQNRTLAMTRDISHAVSEL